MQLSASELPTDPNELRALLMASRAEAAAHAEQLERARALLKERDQQIEALKWQLAKLRRMQFGRSSERLSVEIEQLELLLEELEGEEDTVVEATAALPATPRKAARRPLPKHLPRESIVHAPECACPSCGGALRRVGETVSEMLEYVPARFKVIRHVRPKFACAQCDVLVQAAAASRPIARGLAGPGLLAHVLVCKYADHLPLYRQSQIYAREGVELDRSTLAGWVGECSQLLRPLAEALRRYVLDADKVHADDTPVPVLNPGAGRAKTGRLWAYVRDERPAGSEAPPAVLFRYSPDRKGIHPQRHLKGYRGILQADAYAGFNPLYGGEVVEAGCWAHVRRKFYDVAQGAASPLAEEALRRIAALYAIEEEIRGSKPADRRAARRARASPRWRS